MSDRICSIDGCHKQRPQRAVKGMCSMHAGRYYRHGSPHIVNRGPHTWSTEEATYHAVHKRLLRLRGRAADYPCVDCGASARAWSYQHGDPNEMRELGMPYSTDLSFYVARCSPCHVKFDAAHLPPRPERLTCKYGHPWTLENAKYNKRGSRACKVCAAINSRQRYLATRDATRNASVVAVDQTNR